VKLAEFGEEAVDRVLKELETSKPWESVYLCAFLYGRREFDRAPGGHRVIFLLRLMKNSCDTDPIDAAVVPADEYVESFKKIGQEAVSYLLPVILSYESATFTYPSRPADKVSSYQEDFLNQVIHILIELHAEEAVPARLKARYYLWGNWGKGDWVDVSPLLKIGKDVVPEVIEMISARVIDEDWAVGLLNMITFNYDISLSDEETSEDFQRVALQFSQWWDIHKNQTRTEWAIDGLCSENEFTRDESILYLSQLTGNTYGYDLLRSPAENQESIAKWRQWYQRSKNK
jgi:hypothetical protein